MKAIFDHSESIVDELIVTYWFRPEQPVNYSAGQYTRLFLPHENMDERGDRRWFSLSSSPTEPLLSITTKFSQDSSTFKQTLRELTPGYQLEMAEPMGNFVLPEDKTLPLIFVAGGIGVTPMRSMIKWLNDTGEQRDITLIYAVNQPSEMAFEALLRNYCHRFIPVAKEAPEGWQGETGMLSPECILSLSGATPTSKELIYLSGPEPMVEAFDKGLRELNIDRSRIKTDFFPGYTDV